MTNKTIKDLQAWLNLNPCCNCAVLKKPDGEGYYLRFYKISDEPNFSAPIYYLKLMPKRQEA